MTTNTTTSQVTPLKLNLGCGFRRLPGFVNVDAQASCQPDQVVDLEQFPWPWADNSVDEVHLIHVLEHLGAQTATYLRIMQELWRVCMPGAVVHIIVPHHRHDAFHSDPTHVRAVTPLGLALFDRQQCESWIASGFANTPLALYCGVDFVTEQVIHDFEPRWIERLQQGEITEAQLWDAAQHQTNVVMQVRFQLRVRKA